MNEKNDQIRNLMTKTFKKLKRKTKLDDKDFYEQIRELMHDIYGEEKEK